jgi:hypothetical protein
MQSRCVVSRTSVELGKILYLFEGPSLQMLAKRVPFF